MEQLTSPAFAKLVSTAIHPMMEKLSQDIAANKRQIAEQAEVILALRETICKQQTRLSEHENELCVIKDQITTKKEDTNQENQENDLRVTGLPENELEASEKLISLAKDRMDVTLARDDFSLHVVQSENSPSTADRTPENDVTRNSPVIRVKFNCSKLHQRIYRGRTKLKGTDIYLSEHLNIQNQQLFYLARKLKKAKKIAATWTNNCQVYARTLNDELILIKSQGDLIGLHEHQSFFTVEDQTNS